MRRLLLLVVLGVAALSSTGCFVNQYSSDPNVRMQELLNQSENERQIHNEWARFWFLDQPSHMTFDRVHGGIGP